MRLRLFSCVLAGLLVTGTTEVATQSSYADEHGSSFDGAGADACGVRLAKDDGTLWECTFVDEFDRSTLDGDKWQPQRTSLTGITNGSACYLPRSWNIAVAGGTLRLSAVRLNRTFWCQSPNGGFSTDRVAATVTTKGRFNQAYGRFAFRAKLPTTRVRGAHATLWLYPDRLTYGRWPASGEIDVAEWYSALPYRVFPSVHYVDGAEDVHTGHDGVVPDVSSWHTYALEWTPTTMRFLYDDRLVYEHSWTPLAPLQSPQPFDQPFNIVLTQAWGGQWNAPTASTPDRITMQVDWVRAWK